MAMPQRRRANPQGDPETHSPPQSAYRTRPAQQGDARVSHTIGVNVSHLTPHELVRRSVVPPRGPWALDAASESRSRIPRTFDFVVLFIMMHYVQIAYSCACGLVLCWWHGLRWPLIAVFLTYFPLRIPVHRLGGLPCRGFMLRPFWRCLQRAVNLVLEREIELPTNHQYIFGWHPHGILLLSRFAVYGGLWEALFPGIEFRTLAASALFWLPPVREICILLGAIDAGRRYATKALDDGHSIAVYPGGSREIFFTNPYSLETRIYLKKHTGFVKLALSHGVAIVPVFVFGEKYAYHVVDQSEKGFASWVLTKFRVAVPIFWGRWGSFMPLPGTSLSVVVGKPMEVPRVEEPPPELVEEYVEKYCAQVRLLFDRHRDKYAMKGEYLTIA